MKNVIPLLAFLFLFEGTCNSQSAADSAAVLKVFDSWNQGWANGDASLAVKDYAQKTDWTNAFGDRVQGRDSLLKVMKFIFNLDFVMTGTSEGNEYADVTFLSPDIALLRSKLVRKGQTISTGAEMPDRHNHHLRVLQRQSGGDWKIVSHLISQAHEKR